MKMPNLIENEEGSALIVALLCLVLLTLIGIGATNTTTTDIQIAANEKFHKVAFYHADSGVYTSPKLITEAIDQGTNPTTHGTSGNAINITYLDTGSASTSSFFDEIMGYQTDDSDKDIGFTLDSYSVQVDVQLDRVENLVGGGTEFAAGAEGAGVGSTGGVAIYYDFDSLGSGPKSTESDILAEYRKVVGIAGGL